MGASSMRFLLTSDFYRFSIEERRHFLLKGILSIAHPFSSAQSLDDEPSVEHEITIRDLSKPLSDACVRETEVAPTQAASGPESPSSREKRSHRVASPSPSSPTQMEAIYSLALKDDGEASQGSLMGGEPRPGRDADKLAIVGRPVAYRINAFPPGLPAILPPICDAADPLAGGSASLRPRRSTVRQWTNHRRCVPS